MQPPIEILTLEVQLDGRVETRLVAVRLGVLVGVATVKNLGRKAATLFQLFVDENYRGAGIGRQLVQAAEELAREARSVAMSAVVEDGGPFEFYARLGYEPVHHEEGRTLVSKALSAGRATVR